MKIFKILILIFVLSIYSQVAKPSGTIVGNGGEPLLHFLEAMRFALVETLKDIHLDANINAQFCSEQTSITPKQQKFCRTYLLSILDQMIELNTEPNRVEFVLREHQLLVNGPDGQPMPVSARTQLGHSGPIEFYLDSIKLMAPQNVFHLISHEFQHKSIFNNESPTDNDPIGPFKMGRTLIDSVASALTKVALKKGRVGTAFILRDSFECLIRSGSSQFGVRAATQRWFFDSSLLNYRLSLSKQPSDPLIYIADSIDSKLVFQIEITDVNNCANMTDETLRQSKVSLWRMYNNPNLSPSLLSEKVFPGLNPLCEKVQPIFSADFQTIHFDCKYYGSSAL